MLQPAKAALSQLRLQLGCDLSEQQQGQRPPSHHNPPSSRTCHKHGEHVLAHALLQRLRLVGIHVVALGGRLLRRRRRLQAAGMDRQASSGNGNQVGDPAAAHHMRCSGTAAQQCAQLRAGRSSSPRARCPPPAAAAACGQVDCPLLGRRRCWAARTAQMSVPTMRLHHYSPGWDLWRPHQHALTHPRPNKPTL